MAVLSRKPNRDLAKELEAISLRPKFSPEQLAGAFYQPWLATVISDFEKRGDLTVVDPSIAYGSALKVVRFVLGLSQETVVTLLSHEVGRTVKQSYLSKIESDAGPISPRRVALLCKVMGVPVVFLTMLAEFLIRTKARGDHEVLLSVCREVERRVGSAESIKAHGPNVKNGSAIFVKPRAARSGSTFSANLDRSSKEVER